MSAIIGDTERPIGNPFICWNNSLLRWKYSESSWKPLKNSSIGRLVWFLILFHLYLILFLTISKGTLGNEGTTPREAIMWPDGTLIFLIFSLKLKLFFIT